MMEKIRNGVYAMLVNLAGGFMFGAGAFAAVALFAKWFQ